MAHGGSHPRIAPIGDVATLADGRIETGDSPDPDDPAVVDGGGHAIGRDLAQVKHATLGNAGGDDRLAREALEPQPTAVTDRSGGQAWRDDLHPRPRLVGTAMIVDDQPRADDGYGRRTGHDQDALGRAVTDDDVAAIAQRHRLEWTGRDRLRCHSARCQQDYAREPVGGTHDVSP